MDTTPGKRILIWREFKGLTPAQMIKATGIKRSTLDSVEDPNGSKPSHDTLMKVVDAFPDLSARWLLTGKGEMLDGPALRRLDVDAENETQDISYEEVSDGPAMKAESNPDSYKYQYDALLELVTKGFFGSPEQLLKGLSKKSSASSNAASLFQTVDDIAAAYPIYVEPGFKQAGRQLQFG